MHFIDFIIPVVEHYALAGYFVIFLVFILESLAFVGLVVPGAALLLFVGFLSVKGVLDIIYLFAIASLGSFVGDYISFRLGRRGKNFFRHENRFFKLAYLKKGEAFFHRHGNKSIFLARFIGPIRPVSSFIAGLAKMKSNRFYPINTLSIIVWVAAYLAIGYFFGQAWRAVEIWSSRVGLFLFIIAFFVGLAYVLEKFIERRGRNWLKAFKSITHSAWQAAVGTEEMQGFIARHPQFMRFLRHRLNRDLFTGWPLTLIILAFSYLVFLFAGVVESILTSDMIVELDIRLSNLLYFFRHASLTRFFFAVTLLGKFQLIAGLAALASAAFWLWGKRKYILPMWMALLGSEIFVFFSKIIFHRERPIELSVYLEKSFSFPSGHAAAAVAFYGFLFYFAWRHTRRWNRKLHILFLSGFLIFMIGFSRLYLGVHYLSDVLGGYLLGGIWLLAARSILEWRRFYRDRADWTKLGRRPLRWITAGLAIIALIFYAGFLWQYRPPMHLLKKGVNEPIVVDASGLVQAFGRYNLSQYTETLIGERQEPISFIIAAVGDQELVDLFRAAGWHLADDINFDSAARAAKAALFDAPYPTAPMTPSFWEANVHDFGFEKPTAENTIRGRHHARFWRTTLRMDGKKIYVGTASLDRGLKWWIAHRILPDIDTEREFIVAGLDQTGLVRNFEKKDFVKPVLGKNFIGDDFFTDGQAYLVFLK